MPSISKNKRLQNETTAAKTAFLIDDSFLDRKSDETHRYIVLDAANIMHSSSHTMAASVENKYLEKKAKRKDKIEELNRAKKEGLPPDVYGLLSIFRYFVAKDFDVIAFIPHKFTFEYATNYQHAIQRLIEVNMAKVCETNHYDDEVLIETALRTGGIIITNDQFRDHKARETRLAKFLDGSITVGYEFTKLEEARCSRMTANGHLLKNSTFRLSTFNKGIKTRDNNILHKRFFNDESAERQELSIELRNGWTQDLRDEMLTVLDELMVSNQEEYDNNSFSPMHRLN